MRSGSGVRVRARVRVCVCACACACASACASAFYSCACAYACARIPRTTRTPRVSVCTDGVCALDCLLASVEHCPVRVVAASFTNATRHFHDSPCLSNTQYTQHKLYRRLRSCITVYAVIQLRRRSFLRLSSLAQPRSSRNCSQRFTAHHQLLLHTLPSSSVSGSATT
eukprot:6176757-Pleurochrysis_carterae.AAC.1